MCNYFSDYKITNSNNIDKLKKLESWELAIGLNEVDNLKPSEYLIELTKDSIDNNKTYNEVEEALYTYYSNQDLSNKEIQKTLEADIVTTRIVSIINDRSFRFSPIYLKTIHKKLFSGAFPEELEKYVGVFRDCNLTKEEPILNGKSVIYADYSSIEDFLEYDFNIESNKSYKNLDKLDFVKNISKFTSSIWQIHPFREGNTRTIAVFIIKYLNSKGLSVNNEPFKDNSKYFRDALVLSNYADYTNNIVEDNEYLISFFNLAIFNNSKLKVMNKI
ncbi:MAG: Fic family protein [Clostridiales bacterium]|uniref:Fic family protein n=1 Tax=Terrisporobacter sp. TaxID=1965305 RepID=UPI002A49B172|nr:Fic family protein [Terrisporobacter sp.]MCI5628772.1 Fic family protein [Clostridium sp.]MDD5879245.1 Fic family protein [Clostridiales bacterium]MCI6459673.1 Fic family protein [Clostridium sp.]MCI7206364.1 Fic family protein [Clostridium sp.]MDD7754624.1 Fic family protein [Clostridiales bacterium]